MPASVSAVDQCPIRPASSRKLGTETTGHGELGEFPRPLFEDSVELLARYGRTRLFRQSSKDCPNVSAMAALLAANVGRFQKDAGLSTGGRPA